MLGCITLATPYLFVTAPLTHNPFVPDHISYKLATATFRIVLRFYSLALEGASWNFLPQFNSLFIQNILESEQERSSQYALTDLRADTWIGH